jgi:hypothetical protein
MKGDQRLLIGAVALIVIIGVIMALLPQPAPPTAPLRLDNAAPDGVMALGDWLRAAHFTVRKIETAAELQDVQVLFILEPRMKFSAAERALLVQWMASHTLILYGDPVIVNTLLTSYNVNFSPLSFVADSKPAAVLRGPTLISPPPAPLQIEPDYRITWEAYMPGITPHLYFGSDVIFALLNKGNAHLWLSGYNAMFSNAGLKDQTNAALVENMMSSFPPNAVIGFYETVTGETSLNINGWLLGTPPGWGVLLAIGLTLFYFASSGRRFGRPIPLPEEQVRRDYSEYIVAMANLFQRSGQRTEILKHYGARLRRRLTERYGIDPKLEDTALLRLIAMREPGLDFQALSGLLQKLSKRRPSEADVVSAAREVDDWVKRLR